MLRVNSENSWGLLGKMLVPFWFPKVIGNQKGPSILVAGTRKEPESEMLGPRDFHIVSVKLAAAAHSMASVLSSATSLRQSLFEFEGKSKKRE